MEPLQAIKYQVLKLGHFWRIFKLFINLEVELKCFLEVLGGWNFVDNLWTSNGTILKNRVVGLVRFKKISIFNFSKKWELQLGVWNRSISCLWQICIRIWIGSFRALVNKEVVVCSNFLAFKDRPTKRRRGWHKLRIPVCFSLFPAKQLLPAEATLYRARTSTFNRYVPAFPR